MTIAVGTIDPAYGGPVLADSNLRQGVGAQRARVGQVPIAKQGCGRVRRVPEGALLDGPLPRRHAIDLGANREHGVAEAVELGEALALVRSGAIEDGKTEIGLRRLVESLAD